MLYREVIAVCSQIHTTRTNTLCGQNVEFVNVKLVVPIVTTGLQSVCFVQQQQKMSLCYGPDSSPLLKGKAIPLQAWTGPEGSRKSNFPYFKEVGT